MCSQCKSLRTPSSSPQAQCFQVTERDTGGPPARTQFQPPAGYRGGGRAGSTGTPTGAAGGPSGPAAKSRRSPKQPRPAAGALAPGPPGRRRNESRSAAACPAETVAPGSSRCRRPRQRQSAVLVELARPTVPRTDRDRSEFESRVSGWHRRPGAAGPGAGGPTGPATVQVQPGAESPSPAAAPGAARRSLAAALSSSCSSWLNLT